MCFGKIIYSYFLIPQRYKMKGNQNKILHLFFNIDKYVKRSNLLDYSLSNGLIQIHPQYLYLLFKKFKVGITLLFYHSTA